jgi:hypothetical protein
MNLPRALVRLEGRLAAVEQATGRVETGEAGRAALLAHGINLAELDFDVLLRLEALGQAWPRGLDMPVAVIWAYL